MHGLFALGALGICSPLLPVLLGVVLLWTLVGLFKSLLERYPWGQIFVYAVFPFGKVERFESSHFLVTDDPMAHRRPREANEGALPLPALGSDDELKDWKDETRFNEDLLNKRLAYHTGLFAAVIAGLIPLREHPVGCAVLLALAVVLSAILRLGIERSFAKLSFLLAACAAHEYKPLSVTFDYFDTKKWPKEAVPQFRAFPAQHHTSITVPRFISLSLFVLLAFSVVGAIERGCWPFAEKPERPGFNILYK